MIKVSVKADLSKTNSLLVRQQRQLKELPELAEDQFKLLTPIKSGNARINTNLNSKNEIVADYAYAQRLDQGWSKRQAPKGMTAPFAVWWRKQLIRILGK